MGYADILGKAWSWTLKLHLSHVIGFAMGNEIRGMNFLVSIPAIRALKSMPR
jgi:hypothetical protein